MTRSASSDGNTKATIRVSVRELREGTRRALTARGVSPGEAALAAELAACAEVIYGAGLHMVERALEWNGLYRAPIDIRSGSPDLVDDPERRPILVILASIGTYVTSMQAHESRPLFLPNAHLHPFAVPYLVIHWGSVRLPLGIAGRNTESGEEEALEVVGGRLRSAEVPAIIDGYDLVGEGIYLYQPSSAPSESELPRVVRELQALVDAKMEHSARQGVVVDGRSFDLLCKASTKIFVEE